MVNWWSIRVAGEFQLPWRDCRWNQREDQWQWLRMVLERWEQSLEVRFVRHQNGSCARCMLDCFSDDRVAKPRPLPCYLPTAAWSIEAAFLPACCGTGGQQAIVFPTRLAAGSHLLSLQPWIFDLRSCSGIFSVVHVEPKNGEPSWQSVEHKRWALMSMASAIHRRYTLQRLQSSSQRHILLRVSCSMWLDVSFESTGQGTSRSLMCAKDQLINQPSQHIRGKKSIHVNQTTKQIRTIMLWNICLPDSWDLAGFSHQSDQSLSLLTNHQLTILLPPVWPVFFIANHQLSILNTLYSIPFVFDNHEPNHSFITHC